MQASDWSEMDNSGINLFILGINLVWVWVCIKRFENFILNIECVKHDVVSNDPGCNPEGYESLILNKQYF